LGAERVPYSKYSTTVLHPSTVTSKKDEHRGALYNRSRESCSFFVGVHRAPGLSSLYSLHTEREQRREGKNEKQKTDDPNTAAGSRRRCTKARQKGERRTPGLPERLVKTAQELRAKFLEKKEIELTNN